MATTNTGGNTSTNPGSDLGTSPYQDDVGSGSFGYVGKIPIEFIEFLIGTEIFTLFGDTMINEAFENAFRETSDAFSDAIILENLGGSYGYLTSDKYSETKFTYGKRILRVLRQNTTAEDSDGSAQYYWPCRKDSITPELHENPHSIYFENDPFDPTWHVNITGAVSIRPKNSSVEPTGKVYYMSYPRFGLGTESNELQTHNLGTLNGWHNLSLIGATDEDEIFHGVPNNARVAIYLGTALNLCSGYLSNHVQDDEDVELIQLFNSQVEWLAGKKAAEMKMLMEQYGIKND
tara:strand:+ start:348 stop:1220 length:873 start_codon:yes stop_codon:yes gene_type:complete